MAPVRVVAAVIERDGKFLACRRAPHKSLAGYWEFPGGKVEAGETDEAALTREIREELDVSIKVGDFIGTSANVAGEVMIDLVAYRSVIVDGVIVASSDHDQLMWLTPIEFSKLNWSPADLPVLELLC